MAGVEFLSPDPDGEADEELVVEPRSRRPGPPRRGRRAALVAGGLAVAAAIVVGAVGHSSGGTHRGSAADTGTNPIAPEQPSGANRPDHFGATTAPGPSGTTAPEGARPGRILSLPMSECTSPSGCRVDTSVPPDLVRAVRERFPTAQHIGGRTLITEIDLPHFSVVTRHLTATAGVLRLGIDLHPANDHDDPRHGVTVQGSQRTVYATTLRAGLAVVVTVTGPAASVPSVATVAGLAADARLALSA